MSLIQSHFNIMLGFLLQEVHAGSIVGITGQSGAGKSTLVKALQNSFVGRCITLVPASVGWIVIDDSERNGGLAGRTIFISSLREALSASPLVCLPQLVILENAHRVSRRLTRELDFLRMLLPDCAVLVTGNETLKRRCRLPGRHVAWMELPTPTVDICREVLAGAGGLQSESPALKDNRLIRRLRRLTGGNVAALQRVGRTLALLLESGENETLTRRQRALLYESVGATPGRASFLFILAACALLTLGAGWRYGDKLMGQLPLPVLSQPVSDAVKTASVEITQVSASERDALKMLYAVWGYDVDRKEAWCDQAGRGGLRCLSGEATLDEIAKQGLPWMASIQISGKSLPLVVIRQDNHYVDALIDQQTWQFRREWFEQVWKGEYTLMWKRSPEGNSRVTQQSSPEEIAWLETMLNRVLKTEGEATGEWSALLGEKVKRFQESEGLKADGIAGRMTLVRLWQALGESPRLMPTEEVVQAGGATK